MINIAGLGISGLYIYYRLKGSGFDVNAYEVKNKNFYLPCGFATNKNMINNYLKNINTNINDYLLKDADSVIFAGNNFSAETLNSNGLCTFDKNKLENDLIRDINYKNGVINDDKNITIDATGISRYYLKNVKNDDKFYTMEYLTDISDYNDFYFYFLPGGRGYFWSFPLKNKYHVGVGTKNIDDFKLLNKYKKLKLMSRNIRLKPLFDYMFNNNVIGTGESIGTVSPVTGEGIMPSIKSSEILFNNLKKYDDINELKIHYQKDIKKEFGYYILLNNLINNIYNKNIINYNNIKSIKYVKKTVNDFGIKINIMPFIKHFANNKNIKN